MNFQYRAIGINYTANDGASKETIVNATSFEDAHAKMLGMWSYDKSFMQVWCGTKLITVVQSEG